MDLRCTRSQSRRSAASAERHSHTLWIGAAAIAITFGFTETARAANPPRGLQSNKAEESVPTSSAVRLYFVSATWDEVLNKLAEATGSTLIMDQAPRGRYSRLDRRHYARPEAVQILNRELEPLGYRLLEKGDNLVVLNLSELRNEYRRPQLSAPEEASTSAPPVSAAQSQQFGKFPQRSFQRVAPQRSSAAAVADPDASHPNEDAPETTATVLPAAPRFIDHRPAKSAVRPAAHHVLNDDAAGVENAVQPLTDTTGGAGPAEVRVPLQYRTAIEVARTIYESQKAHAELLDEGPQGLPAFEVKRSGNRPPLPRDSRPGATDASDYVIAINSTENELVVSAPSARARQIERLVQTLDQRPGRRGHVERLITLTGETKRVAAGLQVALNQLVDPRGAEADQEPPAEAQPPAPRTPPRGGPAEGEAGNAVNAAKESPPVQLQLQGPVTVRDVPGVGLVVTGNKADVDAVLNVIRVLELAGSTITPDIHLFGLKNVNSDALAELLNQVYEGLGNIRSPIAAEQRQNVRFYPVIKPNAILIVAPAREMESVLELAEALDQPVDPQAEVEVYPLKHAVATQVVASIDSFYEARKPLGTRVKAVADARTNSVIVWARENDLNEIARLIRKIDQGTSASVSRMRIFPLKNATATELANLINTAIQSVIRPPATTTGGAFGAQNQFPGAGGTGGQAAQQLSEVKSTILEFLSSDGDQQKLIRSGILTDIRVTADPGRNTLIVSAPEASMPLMEVLISQLDQPTPLVAEIKVFTLSNSDAAATVELLRSLFTGQTQQQQGLGGLQNAAANAGIQLAGAEGAGAGLIPLRFSVDPRTNTIIAIGTGDALNIVEAILLRLDESDIRQRKNTVIKLKHSFAADVATAVNQFLTAQRDLAQLDPNLVTNVELLEREIIVVPELVSNSLLISANPRYFQEVVNLIMQLDQKPPEVVIQALLVEVDLTNNDEYGVELGLQDNILFRRSIANVPGFLFNNQQLGNNTGVAGSGDIGTQGLSNFGVNRTNNDLGFGGLVLAASSESVSVLIRALSAKRTVHMLSRPQIRTLDNQLAQILVGQQVPVATGVATTGLTAASPQVQLRDVGIVMTVVPRISPDGTILMEVAATRSSVSANRVPIFTDINTGNTVDSPIINVTTAQATISVPNGQTVVLGGMITKSDDAFERKVPWLGDVPYLGNLFRYEGVNSRRTELLIFLTPRVVRHEHDSEIIKRVEAERLHFIERDAEEVHGPLYSAPPPESYLNRPIPGECNVLPPGLYDQNNVPTTVMPSHPDGTVMPLPGPANGAQGVLPERPPMLRAPNAQPQVPMPPLPQPPLPANPPPGPQAFKASNITLPSNRK